MSDVSVRPLAAGDREAWIPLWDGYNAFYGRSGPTALAPEITRSTWERLLDPQEPIRGLVAEAAGRVVGIAHLVFHRSTISIANTCYLQDLFTAPDLRGRGVGRALIEAACAEARAAGAGRLYWQTHESNAAARRLYDAVADRTGFIVYRILTGR